MSLIYEGGATQGAAQMSQALATGTQQQNEAYKVQVSAQGGEGLWNIAQDMHKKLETDQMRQSNPVESLYLKLEQDATQNRGFKPGSADGQIPGQYQGDQKGGRDLDLIYANDKFSIQLDRPAGVPQLTGDHEKKYTEWQDRPQLQQDWNDFASKNPKAIGGLDEKQQVELMDGFEAAHGQKKTEDFQKLVTSDEFAALDGNVKSKVLTLSKTDADGSRDALALVKDPGFTKLKGQKVPSDDGKDTRLAQDVILDRITGDKNLRTSMLRAVNGTDGFDKLPAEVTPEQRGQALTYMALYAGRKEKGYGEWGDGGKMDDGAKSNALKNLWNNVLSEQKFWTPTSGTDQGTLASQQFNNINSWVGESGYRKPEHKPLG